MPQLHVGRLDDVTRRLLPLYAANMFSGFMLWYAIEKVFMVQLGFDASHITLAAIVVAVTILLSEVPFGIIADRSSRKAVLCFAFFCLAAATFLLPLAANVLTYLVLSSLVGLYFAAESGISESIVYDTLLELRGKRDQYEQYYGRIQIMLSAALVVGSLLGGFVAARSNLQAAYFWSLPTAVAAIVCAALVREPRLHKKHETTFLIHHIRETFSVTLRRKSSLWIMVAIICFGVLDHFLLDVDQLWPLALALPVLWYGPLNALLLLGYGFGGPLASRIARQRIWGLATCIVGVICVLALSIANIVVIAAAQFAFIACFSALLIVAEGRLQDEVPSRLRTGALSVASSTTTLCFLPVAYIFGIVTEQRSVFTASYLLIPITVLGIISYLIFRKPTPQVGNYSK